MFKRLHQNLFRLLERGLVSTFHRFFYINRELVVLENDLSSLGPPMKSLSEFNMKFVEISKHNFEEFHLQYPYRSEYLKAVNELDKGYRAFVIVKGHEVIADMWYCTSINSEQSSLHRDVEKCRIDLGEKGVYVGDLYVRKREEKDSAAFYLLNLALHSLREKGFNRIYGCHWVSNRLASFLYRVFRFKELKRMRESRFLFFRRVKEYR